MPSSSLKKIVIVAGEESGDRHAADLVHQLKRSRQNLQFTAIGGRHLQAEGVPLVSDLARFGVTGVTEVFRYFWIIRRAFKAIQTHLLTEKPDLLILVDYPGFNLRLARFAKKNGIRVLYFISPQIWAWKAGRMKTIQRCIDHMAVILPFEKALYEKAGVPVTFVGHPLVQNRERVESSRESLGLPHHGRLIAMLPGSRVNEIERHMPVLVETVQQLIAEHPSLHFVIPVAETLSLETIQSYYAHLSLPITLIEGHAVEVASSCDAIIVASGTASLECALLEKPMCIIYKGSPLSYLIASCVIQIKYLGLCNILQNRMIVPELLQYDCNAHELTKLTNQLLEDSVFTQSMIQKLAHMKQTLSAQHASLTIHDLVLTLLFKKTDATSAIA